MKCVIIEILKNSASIQYLFAPTPSFSSIRHNFHHLKNLVHIVNISIEDILHQQSNDLVSKEDQMRNQFNVYYKRYKNIIILQ